MGMIPNLINITQEYFVKAGMLHIFSVIYSVLHSQISMEEKKSVKGIKRLFAAYWAV